MVSLYDANLWVALAFAAHPHHAIASQHFKARESSQPTAFCRVTQQAFLRLVSTPLIQRTYASRTITATPRPRQKDHTPLGTTLTVREASQEPKPILFIDEIHLLLGAPPQSQPSC